MYFAIIDKKWRYLEFLNHYAPMTHVLQAMLVHTVINSCFTQKNSPHTAP